MNGFDDSLPNTGDYDFVARAAASGARLVFSPEALRVASDAGGSTALSSEGLGGQPPLRNQAGPHRGAPACPEASRVGTADANASLASAVRPLVQSRRKSIAGARCRADRVGGHARPLRSCISSFRTSRMLRSCMAGGMVGGMSEMEERRMARRGSREAVRDVHASSAQAGSGGAELLLVCSTGGHLLQLVSLEAAWADYTRAWVTLDKSDARSLLKGEQVHFAFGPTSRNVPNLIRNGILAWRVLRDVRPKLLLTTGAGLAVPFAWIARVRRVPVCYVESFTRIESPSLSCRLIAPLAQRVYVQWPELLGAFPRARYAGNLFFDE
jgi:beta-1,4-N-acetylglucosaminyltransferase